MPTTETPEVPGYSIHGLLGRGGMAVVWLATQESLQRKVAIKILPDNSDQGFNERFVNEARFLASISHPRVLTVHDIAQLPDGRHYIAMEFLPGGDLQQRMGKGIAPAEAIDIIRDVAQGLAVVHARGIIHRDIKPANILFRADGVAVLTDFGIARTLAQDSDLTQAGLAVGSPSYSSPEQAQSKPLDQRCDIYSLGVILLEILLKENPFRADNPTQTAINHIQKPVPDLPEELRIFQPLLKKMLAKSPDKRFRDCHQLLQALDETRALLTGDMGNSTDLSGQTVMVRHSPARLLMARLTRPLIWLTPLVVLATLAAVYLNNTQTIGKTLRNLATVIPGMQAPMAPKSAPADTPVENVSIRQDPENQSPVPLHDTDTDTASPVETPAVPDAQVSEVPPEPALPHESTPEPKRPGPVERLLMEAQTRLAAGKLTVPDKDNATWFYEQVLVLEPDNQQALAGIGRIRHLRITRYLELGDQRLEEYKLMVPEQDNAMYYYKQVLTLAPNNARALEGLERIPRRYLGLARTALNDKDYDKAMTLTLRGLELDPGNAALKALKADIEEQSRPRFQRFLDRLRQ